MSDKNISIESVRFLDIVKPDFSAESVLQIIRDIYGIEGPLQSLESERDLNFRVTAADNTRYLFKISNHREPLDNVDFEIAALNHIARTNPDLPVPRVQATLQGTYIGSAVAKNANEHRVRLLSFLPGIVLSEARRTNALVLNQGKIAARIALALQGFFHPAADRRQLLWDVRQVDSLKPVARNISDQKTRTRILEIIENFQKKILPLLGGMRAQVAHMDLTRFNMVVDESAQESVSGVLDFGDMHHGPLIQDVAIAIADVMEPDPDPFVKAQAFLRGYRHVLPLQSEEIEILYDLVLVYFVTYYLILHSRGDSYFASDKDGVLAMIERLERLGRGKVTDLFSHACAQLRNTKNDSTCR